MTLTRFRIMMIAAIFAAIVLGILGSRVLFVGSALIMIPWGICGAIFGYFCRTRKHLLIIGAVYGFVITLSFMISGYQGARPLFEVMPFFALLGIVGIIGGIVSTAAGYLVDHLVSRHQTI